MEEMINSNDVRVLEYPENVRSKPGMYVDDNPSTLLREVVDNCLDEASCGFCKNIIITTNGREYGDYNVVADDGRGIPIKMSPDRPGHTMAELAAGVLHAGSKFSNLTASTCGTYGVGLSVVTSLSDRFIVLSKITPDNYDKSLPQVKEFYESCGPRSRKELFYYCLFQKGYKVDEGAAKKSDIEKMLGFSTPLPDGMSTIIAYIVDREIFPNPKTGIPTENLENFLFIQERFYKRKIQVLANGEVLTSSSIKPYQFEILRTITPADISKNPYIGVYVTFEVDPGLSPKRTSGSVNGLVVNQGVHIQYMEQCFEQALREEFKIKHKTIFPGFRMWVIMLVEDPVYDSQLKVRLRAVSKVKASDFQEIVKDFIKIFRKNEDYWYKHVNKLNALAESYKSIGAVEKAQKMIESASGNQMFRAKSEYVEGFSDATSRDRWNCELFLCFTGETETLTCNNERISMIDLEKRIRSGEEIYTFSCKSDGTILPAKVIEAKKIKEVDQICKVTLDNGESFRCTPDHKLMLRDGSYKEAKDLVPGDSMMPCYITESDNYSEREENRRVILDFGRIGSRRGYRPDETSRKMKGKLVPIYLIMSEHPDIATDESAIGLSTDQIDKHHIDGNRFNDSPRNLLLCSKQRHFSFHYKNNVQRLHELAHEDPDLYNRIYVENKRTESFRNKIKKGLREHYSSEKGQETRDHLREEAVKEWSNEELRKWRSEETKRYAKEHPEWVKENVEKSIRNQVTRTHEEIVKRLKESELELNSYNYNFELIKYRIENDSKKHRKCWPYDRISENYPDLVGSIEKVENDDPVYILAKEILSRLDKKSLEVTTENYNNELKSFGYPVRDGKLMTILKQTSFGFRSSRQKYPNLFSEYEARLNNNHKVVSVEFIEVNKEPVYCLEVDTEEHNFPLAAGIFAKNCEGLSSSGSLKAGRKSTLYHAVLPLRGKILNVKDSTVDEALANKEIFTLLRSVGLGIDAHNIASDCKTPEEAYEKIKKHTRYGKLCISVDAD